MHKTRRIGQKRIKYGSKFVGLLSSSRNCDPEVCRLPRFFQVPTGPYRICSLLVLALQMFKAVQLTQLQVVHFKNKFEHVVGTESIIPLPINQTTNYNVVQKHNLRLIESD